MPRLCSSLLLSLLIASSGWAVTMEWTAIGNPGNACDPQSQGCFGGVGYAYMIGTYEVTNAEYAEFLNAKAPSDPLALYNTNMGSGFGGITRSGVSGGFTYSAIPGRADMPVNWVSFYDALRFANWVHNGQGIGNTETGAYTLLGGTPTPSNGTTVTRNAGATIVLTGENEWYKAAYHDASGLAATGYFDYPAGFDAQTMCSSPPGGAANHANCNFVHDDLTGVGSYTASPSPYGTFDQGGNVWEWNEAIIDGSRRGLRGGGFAFTPNLLAAANRGSDVPPAEFSTVGFRIAMIPEPGTGMLVIAGLLGIGGWRRGRV